jgi:hypothetical protein
MRNPDVPPLFKGLTFEGANQAVRAVINSVPLTERLRQTAMSNAVLINMFARWLGAPQPALRHTLVPNQRGQWLEQEIHTNNPKLVRTLDVHGVNVCKHIEVTQRHTVVMAAYIALLRAKGFTCYPECYIRDVTLHGADLPPDQSDTQHPLYAPIANNRPRRCDWAFIDKNGRQCFVDITFANTLTFDDDGKALKFDIEAMTRARSNKLAKYSAIEK